MADKKHHVFSARTTPEGLAILNGIRAEHKIGWDELVIAAVNAHWGVEVPMLPKDTGREEAKAKAEVEKAEAKAKVETEKAEAKAKAEAEKAEAKAKKEAEAKAKKEAKEAEKVKKEAEKAEAKAMDAIAKMAAVEEQAETGG